ncbi:MAG: class I SAM-dependent methyltransferase [Arcicella sp.]|nr:class I SAM-dependent methyltransferase [Arcicella sp.]
MENFNRQSHWENIYQTKNLTDVSWYQPKPTTSLSFFSGFKVPKNAKIIDVGGGDSLLVDFLLDEGYTDLTVLDISESSLKKAQNRLGIQAKLVKWIVSDITEFVPTERYDFWHDRAAFHFSTNDSEVKNYLKNINENVVNDGILVLGTFSEKGPNKCSGIEIKQYSKKSLVQTIGSYFKKVKCLTENHKTPFNTVQNFVFCSFIKNIKTA